MKVSPIILMLLFGLATISAPPAASHELSGYVASEVRAFFHEPLFPEQERDNASLALQLEYYHKWDNGSSFLFVPFARFDSADAERSHLDIRELNYLWLGEAWELRVGIGKVFWGVTEFVHLVDIINQTDLVEDIDGEEKLGQPMVNLTLQRHWGTVNLFVLPYFRERTFPGPRGRLRSSPVVDTDNPAYESTDEERHIDFAVRYSHSIGDWDFGIYNFKGTGREPTLLVGLNEEGRPVLIPFYEQINQTGLDLQLVAGQWLWKLEALYRSGKNEDFLAAVSGFEYSFVGIFGTRIDLGVLGEWAYDERGNDATTSFQNDAMLGLRLTLNDAASSKLLAGFGQDINSATRALSIEASRRFGNNWLLSIESRAFFDLPEDDPLYSIHDDDYLRIELAYYF